MMADSQKPQQLNKLNGALSGQGLCHSQNGK